MHNVQHASHDIEHETYNIQHNTEHIICKCVYKQTHIYLLIHFESHFLIYNRKSPNEYTLGAQFRLYLQTHVPL